MTTLGSSSEHLDLLRPFGWILMHSCVSSPDRWNDVPDAVQAVPGLYNHTLTFSAGPRVSTLSSLALVRKNSYTIRQACIGVRMSIIELKSFLFILVTNFKFAVSPDHKIGKANV